MSFRLEKLITDLLINHEYNIISGILDYLDVEGSCNCLNDLVDIAILCNKSNDSYKIESLGWFKKRLVNKIYEQRGTEGKTLIEKVMK